MCGRPQITRSVDQAWISTAALCILGIGRRTNDVKGSGYVRFDISSPWRGRRPANLLDTAADARTTSGRSVVAMIRFTRDGA